MKWILSILTLFYIYHLEALEFEVQFENEQIRVAKVKLLPFEEIGPHRDLYPQIVVALKGGSILRLEADSTTTEVEFPTGVTVMRKADPVGQLHRAVSRSSEPIELLIIQLKSNNEEQK